MSHALPPISTSLSHCLNLKPPLMISLVGAGGKTSTMLNLAGELSGAGHSVLVTTSTKIFKPELPLLLESDPHHLQDEIARRLRPGGILAAGAKLIPAGPLPKLDGLSPDCLDGLFTSGAADYIIVEADGSRRLPLKAPRPGEPVIPAKCGLVLGVAGLSVLDKAATDERVFALERFLEICGLQPGASIDLPALLALARHENGMFKNCPQEARKAVFFNQLDLLEPERQKAFIVDNIDLTDIKTIIGSIHKKTFYCPR